MYYIVVFLSSFVLGSLAGIKFISWDVAIISMSIMLAASLVSSTIEEKMSAFISTIKEQMETRQNSDSKDEKDNERN